MAGIVNRSKTVNNCDIFLDGGLASNVKAALVKELIKYFMYERQQIPVPFDHLKRNAQEESLETENVSSKTWFRLRSQLII